MKTIDVKFFYYRNSCLVLKLPNKLCPVFKYKKIRAQFSKKQKIYACLGFNLPNIYVQFLNY